MDQDNADNQQDNEKKVNVDKMHKVTNNAITNLESGKNSLREIKKENKQDRQKFKLPGKSPRKNEDDIESRSSEDEKN